MRLDPRQRGTPDDLSDPTLAALLADIEAAQSRLRAYLVACAAPPSTGPRDREFWPDDPSDPDLIPTVDAARRARRGLSTIQKWCAHAGIGKMYGDRWRVSSWRLSEKLNRKF